MYLCSFTPPYYIPSSPLSRIAFMILLVVALDLFWLMSLFAGKSSARRPLDSNRRRRSSLNITWDGHRDSSINWRRATSLTTPRYPSSTVCFIQPFALFSCTDCLWSIKWNSRHHLAFYNHYAVSFRSMADTKALPVFAYVEETQQLEELRAYIIKLGGKLDAKGTLPISFHTYWLYVGIVSGHWNN